MTLFLQLFWVFFKVGLFCWGGGLVIVPLLEDEVVFHYGWLSSREFLNAVTFGQVSPGPVVISATFIGYRVCGFWGAVIATASVILPSYILICIAAEFVDKFRGNKYLMGFFFGARAAVIALIFEAALSIGKTAIDDLRTLFIFMISMIALSQFKFSPIGILLIAAGIGLIT